ncbi:LAMI_0F08064g1_1 [Lachancea mirantina]|uniref:LAMI_0F08064g1_1 n=1 Tax=Lachancea mirantina TaxID=1230905 RepID=A0A1G4K0E6_9SACH|nr:LAMI_0F08064g1_1 [Lachancea mirantina]
MEGSGASKSKGRTFTGCWACRFKKRRCDEQKPICSLCKAQNDQCSYDVQLVWRSENIYAMDRDKKLVSWKKLHNLCHKNHRHCISRKKFREMTHFRQVSPPNSDNECEAHEGAQEDLESPTFTISVRRLKIYDQAIPAVHGCRDKNFDVDHVHRRLDTFLDKIERSSASHSGDIRWSGFSSGPFDVFRSETMRIVSKRRKIGCRNEIDPQLDACAAGPPEVPLAGWDEKALHSSLPATPSSLEQSELIPTGPSDFPGTTRDLAREFCKYHWQNLLLENGHNFCIRQPDFVGWLTTRAQRYVRSLSDDLLQEIFGRQTKKDRWTVVVEEPSSQFQDFQIMLLFMASASAASSAHVVSWLCKQSQVTYAAFPLIAHALASGCDLSVLFHCHELLTNANIEDIFQYDLGAILKINAERLILQYWNNLMTDQMSGHQDTSLTELQLKYWEVQLQYNEEFYREVCLA